MGGFQLLRHESPDLERAPRSRREAVEAATTPRWLHLVVLPTEACNFRCTYCYESFALGRMRRDVETGVVRLIERRIGGLDDLSVSWFGGEPLLAFDVMARILGRIQTLLRENPSVRFLSDVTTNGSRASIDRVERLVELGVSRFQVSLDGVREVHDATRRRRGRSPTFDAIWNNLEAAHNSELSFNMRVRLHLHRENVLAVHDLLPLLATTIAGDRRFHLFFKAVKPLGSSADGTFPFLARAEASEAIAALRAAAARYGLQCAADAADGTGMCYAARANSFVIRADGRVNKCTVALDHPANDVGRLDAEGHLELVEGALAPWTRGLRSGDGDALHCPRHGIADASAVTSPVRFAHGAAVR